MKLLRASSDHQTPRCLTLNDLPANVIDEVLERLDVREAIGTSLISRFWRHRWKSIPKLDFVNTPEHFVNRVLLLHSGHLRTFKFLAPETNPSVDSWLIALSSRVANSLRSLKLGFYEDFSKYRLHSAAFSFNRLTRLMLFDCYISPPHEFSGFKHLRFLWLDHVSFPNGSQLSTLISASPSLSKVLLYNVVGSGCLKVSGPSIHSLEYYEVYFDDFALGSCPLLAYTDMRLCVTDSGHSYNGGDYDMQQWLALGWHSSKTLATFGIPARTSIKFDRLSVMTLGFDIKDKRSVSAAVYLLRSCPNLTELRIMGYYRSEFEIEAATYIWSRQRHTDIFPKLRKVEMVQTDLLEECELEIIRLILETAQVLETMVIDFDNEPGLENMSAIRKLLAFRRASNQAQIICTLRAVPF